MYCGSYTVSMGPNVTIMSLGLISTEINKLRERKNKLSILSEVLFQLLDTSDLSLHEILM